ncbi:beta strand repeat-containing protein [Hanstruepera ponticola]|uniref:beta strand repeat-containing protein n=1 Tax=Hanstruepera ponticola TaxID=2042995 RepID=UPI001786949A|nr:hypothetical protein [Hanstruepera ponticola]
MKFKVLFLFCYYCFTINIVAQVGIGTTNPDASSILDITASDKGVLVPRVNLTDVTNTTAPVASPATGLLVWNTNAGTTGGNGVGFYFFNGTQWTPIQQSQGDDHDFYEEGTTTAPDDINDDLFTMGHLAIGKNTADYPLDILDNDANIGTYLSLGGIDDSNRTGIYSLITNSGNGRQYGINTGLNGGGAGEHGGLYAQLQGTGNGTQVGVRTAINNSGSGNHYGVDNLISGSGSGEQYGVRNRVTNNGNDFHYGTYNSLSGSGNGRQYGIYNLINNSGSDNHYGSYNFLSGTGTGIQYGTINFIDNTGSGLHYGNWTRLQGTGTGEQYGNYVNIINTGNAIHYGGYVDLEGVGSGIHYGLYNTLGGSGTGRQYGVYNEIDNSGNANHFGSYSALTGTGSGSHYGNWVRLEGAGTGNQIGAYNYINNTGNGDHYGSYNVLSGTGSGPHYGDWIRLQGTGTGLQIGDYIYIDNSGNSNHWGEFIVLNGSGSGVHYGSVISLSGTGTGDQTGFRANISNSGNGNHISLDNNFSGTGNGPQYGVKNYFFNNGASNPQYGLFNEIYSQGEGSHYGMYSTISNNGNGNKYGVYSQISGSGSGTKYGSFNTIANSAGGTHYGVYSNVLKAGSYAGYFLGNVSIGTTTGNNYILPASRGTNGQIMQTDGIGNVSWVNNPSVSYWSRTGNTLDVATAADDISFTSDQTSIIFPNTNGTPSSMMYMFQGAGNVDRMVLSHSPAFPAWGLEYEDATDSFIFKSSTQERVEIDLAGGYPLRVYGTARAVNFESDTTTYPDYVFESYFQGYSKLNTDYTFKTLAEVETFIKENGHLPNVKSYQEVKDNRMTIDVGEMTVTNLEKIEEAYLYIIELKKENDLLKEKLEKQQHQIDEIKRFLNKD